MDNQTPAEQAATAALDELYGLGYNYHDRFADKVKAVGLNDVTAVSRARLTRCVVTVSTPAPDAVKVNLEREEGHEVLELSVSLPGKAG